MQARAMVDKDIYVATIRIYVHSYLRTRYRYHAWDGTGCERVLKYFLYFFAHPGAIYPMGAI